MKKYITLAALLAAGTACANAETLTLTSPTDGSLTSSNAAIAWSEDYTTLLSWEISFTLTDTALGDAILFGTDRDTTGAAGYLLSTNTDGSLEVYARNIDVNYSKSTAAGVVTAGTPIAITFSFIANYNETTDQVVGGTFSLKAGETIHSWDVDSGLGYTDLTNNSVSRFWTNDGAEQFSNITVSKLDNNIVPEPSAFGMLAGLGALALVASRRRRK
ncbi:MAG: PEP-CTERM sorting domain-containing protein [Opitutales bacterium]|nr:PEP-CTERM sorting domain-containing protein [Opitutales bacterium]